MKLLQGNVGKFLSGPVDHQIDVTLLGTYTATLLCSMPSLSSCAFLTVGALNTPLVVIVDNAGDKRRNKAVHVPL